MIHPRDRPIHLFFRTWRALDPVRWLVRVLVVALGVWLIQRGDGNWVEAVVLVAGSIYVGFWLFVLLPVERTPDGVPVPLARFAEEHDGEVSARLWWLSTHPVLARALAILWSLVSILGMMLLLGGPFGWLSALILTLASLALGAPSGVFIGAGGAIFWTESAPETAPLDVRTDVRWNRGWVRGARWLFYLCIAALVLWTVCSTLVLARHSSTDTPLLVVLDVVSMPYILIVALVPLLMAGAERYASTPEGREVAELDAGFGDKRREVYRAAFLAVRAAVPPRRYPGPTWCDRVVHRAMLSALRSDSFDEVRRGLQESLAVAGPEHQDVVLADVYVERISRQLWNAVQEARAAGHGMAELESGPDVQ